MPVRYHSTFLLTAGRSSSSYFDRWKDPLGVIEAFRKARKEGTWLVRRGQPCVDDPEGDVILEIIDSSVDDGIIVVTVDDPVLVNALQRRAAVVLQKSDRRASLPVTEADVQQPRRSVALCRHFVGKSGMERTASLATRSMKLQNELYRY